MKIHPTVRILVLVTFALIIGLGGTWLYLRNKGLSDPISPVRHTFFSRGERVYLIADPALNSDPIALPALEQAAKIHPMMILWIDVQLTNDDQLVVLKLRDLVVPEKGSRLVGLSDFSELQQIVGQPVLKLVDVLKAFPTNRFVLNIRDYRPGLDGKLAQTIDELQAGDRVLIQSDQDGILRDLRALRPTWLFGTSQAQITQLLMLLPFGLESVAPMKGDVYVSTSSRGRPNPLTKAVGLEMRRRGRVIFVGPVENIVEARQLRALGADGFISANPESLLELFK